jgi:hypothetical protein
MNETCGCRATEDGGGYNNCPHGNPCGKPALWRIEVEPDDGGPTYWCDSCVDVSTQVGHSWTHDGRKMRKQTITLLDESIYNPEFDFTKERP